MCVLSVLVYIVIRFYSPPINLSLNVLMEKKLFHCKESGYEDCVISFHGRPSVKDACTHAFQLTSSRSSA